MLDLTRQLRKLDELREQVKFFKRTGDTDRAGFVRDLIVVQRRRVQRLSAEDAKKKVAKSKEYRRTRYIKFRAEYFAGPAYQSDLAAKKEKLLARLQGAGDRMEAARVARHAKCAAERAPAQAERAAKLAAMSPEERHAYRCALRAEGMAWRAERKEQHRLRDERRLRLAQEKREKFRLARLARLAARLAGREDPPLISHPSISLPCEERPQSASPLNTNPVDSPGLLSLTTNGLTSPSNV